MYVCSYRCWFLEAFDSRSSFDDRGKRSGSFHQENKIIQFFFSFQNGVMSRVQLLLLNLTKSDNWLFVQNDTAVGHTARGKCATG